jgi:hypothetical protein
LFFLLLLYVLSLLSLPSLRISMALSFKLLSPSLEALEVPADPGSDMVPYLS